MATGAASTATRAVMATAQTNLSTPVNLDRRMTRVSYRPHEK